MGNSSSSPRRIDENNESFRNRVSAQLLELSRLLRNGATGDVPLDTRSATNSSSAHQTFSNQTNDNNASTSNESRTSSIRPRYMLRRTSARLRRSAEGHDETVESSRSTATTPEASSSNASNTIELPMQPQNDDASTSSRRRTRRPSFDDDAEANSARRPRLLSEVIGDMIGEEANRDDASFYFFFPLIQPPQPATPAATTSHSANVFTNTINGRSSTSLNSQSPRLSPPAPQVFVRVNQRLSEDNQPALQWTLYFLMPQINGEAADAPTLPIDPQTVLMQAFAAFNNLMINDELTYEQMIRIQEMMGTVNRGVSTEMIDAKIKKFMFVDAQSSGLAGVAAGTSCSICLQDFIVDDSLRTLPCTHSYHSECIDKWLNQVNKCPLCRQEPVNRDEAAATSAAPEAA